jgi:DNA-binding response OmpR family regulator
MAVLAEQTFAARSSDLNPEGARPLVLHDRRPYFVIDMLNRVLVVDDEPRVAAMLNDVLKTLGYAVELAHTGPDAIRAVPAFRPDVVLLNVGLPGIPGELVLDCLHVSDPDVPIIMMTGDRRPDLEREVRARGAYDFVTKPFKLDWLMLRLKAALAFRHSR